MTDAVWKAVHMEIIVHIIGNAIAKMILLLGKFIEKMDASLKAMDVVMQIIFNISGKAITEMIPQLGKFTEKILDASLKAMAMVMQIIMTIVTKTTADMYRLLGKFSEKVEGIAFERAANLSVDAGTSYLGLGSDMQLLSRNLNALRSRASDINEAVERAELSGRQKGKTEVKHWLEEVETLLDNDFIALQRREQQGGILNRLLIGGHARKMKNQADELTDQSRHFNGLLLEKTGE
ncbi:uncharacterized protein LOC113772429 [Coffea eugenioides]|uniref:uncharacterized protein LOC113772429 n=1 Tax=Coffea eugenioides TaxID=49369 RepID=UPI000F60CFC4|nr:uncharacterized protein LOC113772429 [Coffea eugenioides]